MNKFTLPALAAGMLALGSCSKTPQVTITLEGFTDSTLVVSHATVDGYLNNRGMNDPRVQHDTLTAHNNQIVFTPADSTSVYLISPNENPLEYCQLLVEPGDRLDIHLKMSEGKMTHTLAGTRIAEAVTDYDAMMKETMALYAECRGTERMTEQFFDSIGAVMADKVLEWTKKHIGNPATALYARQLDPDTLLDNYDFISKDLKGTEVEPLLKSAYDLAEKQSKIRKAEENIKEGAEAPDFTLQDKDGKAFTFSSLRGRWAVIDFWGTWCGWCIKGIPDMKEAQARIADKCAFVSIACGDTHEKWLKSLETHQMPWTQVIVPDDCPTDLNPAVAYAVKGFPTKIIVSPEGRIAKIVVGESPEFYEALGELIK